MTFATPNYRFVAFVLIFVSAIALLAVACEGVAEDPTPVEEPSTVTIADAPVIALDELEDQQIAELLRVLDAGYQAVEGAWVRFDPIVPTVIIFYNQDFSIDRVLAINHSNPSAIGDFSIIDTGLPSFELVALIDNLTHRGLQRAASTYGTSRGFSTFDCGLSIGRISTFVFPYNLAAIGLDGGRAIFDPQSLEVFVSVLLHERFHCSPQRVRRNPIRQDFDGYDFSSENIELALLEDEALTAAVLADNVADVRRNAEYFSAIRAIRIERDRRVLLDSHQEYNKGPPRYIEHQLGFEYTESNYQRDFGGPSMPGGTLLPIFEPIARLYFGQLRWYTSGAAIVAILERLDVLDFQTRINGGETPADILADFLSISPSSFEELEARARHEYDPDNLLPALAESYAEQIQTNLCDRDSTLCIATESTHPGMEVEEPFELLPGLDLTYEPTATTLDELYSTQFAKLLGIIDTGYRAAAGVWSGFNPANISTAIIFYDEADGTVDRVLSIGHPNPSVLGEVSIIDTATLTLESVAVVETPTHTSFLRTANELGRVMIRTGVGGVPIVTGSTIITDLPIDGVPTFVIPFNLIGGLDVDGEPDFRPHLTSNIEAFVSALIHEQFHGFQISVFTDDGVPQDTLGYDYSVGNIELALLEDEALIAAVSSDNTAEIRQSAEHFVAIRGIRLKRDERVRLDQAQERIEGTATHIEHQLNWIFTNSSYRRDFEIGTTRFSEQLRRWFGFNRFYTSGAAILTILDRLGVPDFQSRIENGEFPADVLSDHLSVDPKTFQALEAQARSEYDPDNALPALAESYVEQIQSQP